MGVYDELEGHDPRLKEEIDQKSAAAEKSEPKHEDKPAPKKPDH